MSYRPSPDGASQKSRRKTFTLWACGILFLGFCTAAPFLDRGRKKEEAEAYSIAAAYFNTNTTHVLPYDPSSPAFVIIVPVNTSDREAQELGLGAKHLLQKVGMTKFVHVETPQGQRLATISSW